MIFLSCCTNVSSLHATQAPAWLKLCQQWATRVNVKIPKFKCVDIILQDKDIFELINDILAKMLIFLTKVPLLQIY